jgi:hypothetical protein
MDKAAMCTYFEMLSAQISNGQHQFVSQNWLEENFKNWGLKYFATVIGQEIQIQESAYPSSLCFDECSHLLEI